VWVPWSYVEPQEGRWDFSHVEELFDAAIAAGMTLDVTICQAMSPQWFISKWFSAEKGYEIWPMNHKGERALPSTSRVHGATPSVWHPQARKSLERLIENSFRRCLNSYSRDIVAVRTGMRFNEWSYPTKRSWWMDGVNLGHLHSEDDRGLFIHRYLSAKNDFTRHSIARIQNRLDRPAWKGDTRIIAFLAGFADVEDPIAPYPSHIQRLIEKGWGSDVLRGGMSNRFLCRLAKEMKFDLASAGVGINALNPNSGQRRMVKYAAEKGLTVTGQIPAFSTAQGVENPEDVCARAALELGMSGWTVNKADSEQYFRIDRRGAFIPGPRWAGLKKAVEVWA